MTILLVQCDNCKKKIRQKEIAEKGFYDMGEERGHYCSGCYERYA